MKRPHPRTYIYHEGMPVRTATDYERLEKYVDHLESQLEKEREEIILKVHTAYENLMLGHTQLGADQLSELITSKAK